MMNGDIGRWLRAVLSKIQTPTQAYAFARAGRRRPARSIAMLVSGAVVGSSLAMSAGCNTAAAQDLEAGHAVLKAKEQQNRIKGLTKAAERAAVQSVKEQRRRRTKLNKSAERAASQIVKEEQRARRIGRVGRVARGGAGRAGGRDMRVRSARVAGGRRAMRARFVGSGVFHRPYWRHRAEPRGFFSRAEPRGFFSRSTRGFFSRPARGFFRPAMGFARAPRYGSFSASRYGSLRAFGYQSGRFRAAGGHFGRAGGGGFGRRR